MALLAFSAALILPATAQAQNPPTLSSAEVGADIGTTIELIFSEDLHQVPLVVPTAIVSAFTVKVDGVERQISNIVANVPSRFGITMSSAIYQGQTVVVSYDKSVAGTNAIADSDGDEVASFTTGVAGVPAVVNSSTVAPPLSAPTGFRAEAGDGEVTLSWDPPGSGSDVTHHDYRFRTNGSYGNWIEIDDSGPGETNASGFTVTRDIVNGRAYTFQLRAGGDDGDSLAAEAGRVTPEGPPMGLAPTVTSVVVASAPQSGDTYRLYETIVFTVTFSEPVELKPQGRLRLKVGLDNPGGASGSTVEAVFSGLSQSQRPTADTPQARLAPHMHFEYKVKLFDRDADGVRIRANALRLASGARIRSEGGRDAELDHAAVGPLSDHKVDGSADVPMIERIGVVSTPRLVSRGAREPDTYGEGETIRIEVRFDQPVHVEGEPAMALEVGDPCRAVCEARYESGSGTDTLVFAYLVLEVDVDRNGIAIRGNPIEVPSSGDSIRNAADQDAHLSSKGKGTQRGHKTDGSRAAGPHLSVEDAEAHEADGEMEFTVRLEPHGLGIVTVDYATADGTGSKAARAGSDYTETRGTLRFNPLETERTVTVPITDDAHEDDGETFTLTLSNPDGAKIRGDDGEATGTIRNSEIQPLTATFEDVPSAHDGESAFRFRMAFSEDIGISYRSLREDALAVTGGRVTRGARVDDRRDLFEMTVEPDGDGEVTVTLPAGRECGISGAICTKGENRRQLTNTPAATVAGPAVETGPAGLTAAFVGMPSAHRGEGGFRFRVAFSEDIGISFRSLREDAFTVTGGRVTGGKRVAGRRDLFEMTVRPTSVGDVTITLLAGRACAVSGAICTKGENRRKLTNAPSTTVRGPVSVSVADARAEEGTDETLDFAVSLSRAASATVAVAYATADGSATAGSDYTAHKGQLSFAPGETAKTVRVPVLDDAHDEGAETLSLRLSAASGALIADGVATGTIENADSLQQAWLARFGRTAATHVTDAVSDRLRGTPGQDSHLTVGGYRLPLGQRGATGKPEAGGATPGAEADTDSSSLEALVTGLAGVLGLGPGQAGGTGVDPGGGLGGASWPDSGRDPRLGQSQSVNVDLRRLLLGSSFRLALGGDAVGARNLRLTAWGRVAGTTFDGRDGTTLTLDGDVLTGTVGVDGEWDRLLAGLAVAHSRGNGSFTMPGTEDRGQGGLETTLTSVHPYLRYAVNDRLAVWGLFGYGWGELDLEMDNGDTIETDTNLVMGAFGGRGILLSAAESGGFQLATRTDAMLTRTTSDKVAEMESAEADAHRLRLVLEGSRGFAWAEGRRLTPTMEVGLRHDWGDAETGFGLELGGRVQYADPALGLTIEAAVRGLLAHEDSDYQEWGASGTVRVAPGAMGQGLSLTLAPAWGATASGVDGLWSRQTTAGLAPQGNRAAPVGRLTAEIGYGVAAPFDTGLLTPYAGTVLSDGADRSYRVGGRLQLNGGWATGLALNLEGMRQEPAGQQPVNQGLRLQATWRF